MRIGCFCHEKRSLLFLILVSEYVVDFSELFFLLTVIWKTGAPCFTQLPLLWKASWISCAIEGEMDNMYGIPWRRLRIAHNYVSNCQLTKWRD